MLAAKSPSADTLRALETAPNMYLILSPELYILTASDLYLQATGTTRDAIRGKHIFEAFPDNPQLPDADGVQNINASLQNVLRTKEPDYMRVQRYDVPDQQNPGAFIQRYWDPCHTPVLDEDGNISYIIQMATNVTDKITADQAMLKSRLEQLETAEQISGLNKDLLIANIELREAQEQLYALNRQLEERVAKRTDELATANEEQAAINEELTVMNEEITATNEELTEIQQRLEQINRELEVGASRLRLAVESTGLGSWEYYPLTGELYWSKECRAIFGVAPDVSVSFDTYAVLIHPEDNPWVSDKIQASMQPGNTSRYEITHRIIRADTLETRWVKAQGTVDFEQGKATRSLGTVLDITELKQVEEHSARLAAIVTSSDDAIISKTLESVITTWNDGAERLFGYTADEMIGETIYKLIPDDRQEEEPMILSRLKSGERIEHFETQRQTKDGRLIDVSLTISPIKNNQGQIIGLSKIARDISERKKDEIRKNDFIGMVSHELKTPLTSLSAILQLLQNKLKKSEDPFVNEGLRRANVQAKKMSTMINGFLNISRLESGKIQIDKQAFIIGDLIREVISETNLTGPSHSIELEHCDKVVVQADQEKIGSVLTNLLGNAVKYSPKGSAIRISCKQLDQAVQVSISDEGLGIRPEDRDHIFDRYHRVENNRNISGFGIGLYLSAEIIQRHGGQIWVESQNGIGSTFHFTLPVNDKAAV
jgi:PAS domain S-box-containing protein